MNDNKVEKALIPALLAAAAVYLGISRNSTSLGNLAKDVVSRVVNDQVDGGVKRIKNRRHKQRKRKQYLLTYENNNH